MIRAERNIDAMFEREVHDSATSSAVIIELGGVSRPVLKKAREYQYIGIDIDPDFESSLFYDRFYCQSVEKAFPEKGDLIFSKYLMEHVKDAEASYDCQLDALNEAGTIIHLYPLGFHPFSLLNKFFGNGIAKKLIPIIRKGSEDITGYPAFYSLGNAYNLERYFVSRNDLDVKFIYHYGCVDYFAFFYPLALLVHCFNLISKKLSLKIFASNVLIIIKQKQN